MFGGVFHDYLEAPWEQARGYLKEELEQLFITLGNQWGRAFSVEGTLTADAIDGVSTVKTVYVSNEGPRGKPKWAKIDLPIGVKNRLRLPNFAEATANTLLGRREASVGDYEPIVIGDGLELISTTTLTAQGAKWSRSFLTMGG